MLVVLVVLLVPLACASFIRMNTNIYVEPVVNDGSTAINVSLSNSGDEPAHDAQVSLVLPDGFTTNTAYIGMMYPNFPYNADFNVSISSDVPPGRYPIVLKLHYADANAYPFSVVSPSFLMYKEATPIMIRGFMPEISIGTSGDKGLTLRLSNLDSKPHSLSVRIVTSDELKVDSSEKQVNVPGSDESELSYKIKSFGALAGSTYIVFAVVEYDDGGRHYSSIATGVVKVVSGDSGLGLPAWLPLVVLVVLIAVFVYYQLNPKAFKFVTKWLKRKRR